MTTRAIQGSEAFASYFRKVGFIGRRVDTASLIKRIVHIAKAWRDMRTLSGFDDRMLRDIGVSRPEIEGGARFGWP